MAKCKLFIEIEYDPRATDPESLATALDTLMGTATSTEGILDEYGDPKIGEFFVLEEPKEPDPKVTDDEGFDTFLDDATHKLREMWEERGGAEIKGAEELYSLNDVLTTWFSDKKS